MHTDEEGDRIVFLLMAPCDPACLRHPRCIGVHSRFVLPAVFGGRSSPPGENLGCEAKRGPRPTENEGDSRRRGNRQWQRLEVVRRAAERFPWGKTGGDEAPQGPFHHAAGAEDTVVIRAVGRRKESIRSLHRPKAAKGSPRPFFCCAVLLACALPNDPLFWLSLCFRDGSRSAPFSAPKLRRCSSRTWRCGSTSHRKWEPILFPLFRQA